MYDKDYIWLIAGNQRRTVYVRLKPEFLSNQLRREINQTLLKPLSLREISRQIKDFERRRLVRCLNPNAPYNKIYMLTQKGKELQKKLLNSHLNIKNPS